MAGEDANLRLAQAELRSQELADGPVGLAPLRRSCNGKLQAAGIFAVQAVSAGARLNQHRHHHAVLCIADADHLHFSSKRAAARAA